MLFAPFADFLRHIPKHARQQKRFLKRLPSVERLEDRLMLAYDFGDAPDVSPGTGPGDYQTLIANNGPRHLLDTSLSTLFLGSRVDGEGNAIPNAKANGDDSANVPDDETGVFEPGQDLLLTVGTAPIVRLRATNTTGSSATLYGWIDYNRDGNFDNATERASLTVPTSTTNATFALVFPTIPDSAENGTTFARFRLSTDSAAANPTGPASDGEVEDYTATLTRVIESSADTTKTREIASGLNGGPTLDFAAFGTSLASLGDFDGDGVNDLVVGEPLDSTNGTNGPNSFRGAVYLLLLNPNGTVKSSLKLASGTNGVPALTDQEGFGFSVVSLGDLDGDGVTDLAVGAPSDGFLNQGTATGAVYVLFLNQNGTVKSSQKLSSATNGVPTLDSFANFGSSLSAVGDLDGDGIIDLAVGAAGVDINRGALYLLRLNQFGTVKSSVVLSSGMNGLPELADYGHFGGSVTSLGDLDGDGVTDVAVGSWGESTTGNNRGAVHVMLLNTNGTVKGSTKLASGVNGAPQLSDDDRFGCSVASLGDIDGDGITDLAVGAYGDHTAGSFSGAVHVLLLNSNGTAKGGNKLASDTNGGPALSQFDQFGSSLTLLGDLDGDGAPDLAVGAPSTVVGGHLVGAAYVVFSTPIAPNVAPIAQPMTINTEANVPITGLVTATDQNSDPLIFSVGTVASVHGTVVINPNGTFTFTPNPGFTGVGSFTFRASDGSLISMNATVTVNIGSVGNTAPMNLSLSNAVVQENVASALVGILSAQDADFGDTLTYSITQGEGLFTIVGNQLRVGPNGLDHEAFAVRSVILRATDAGGLSVERVFPISISDINEAPVVNGVGAQSSFAFTNRSASTLLPSINVFDPDGQTDIRQIVLTISTPAAKKNRDVLLLNGLNGLAGISETNESGIRRIVANLNANITSSSVRDALRSITFTTKGSSLKTVTRQIQIQAIDAIGAVSNIGSTVMAVSKKPAPLPPLVTARPGSHITVTGSAFNTAAETYLVFTNRAGWAIETAATAISSTSVTGIVPVFFNFDTFQIESGEVSVSIRQVTTLGSRTFSGISRLQIEDLPQTGLTPGTLQLRFLDELVSLNQKAIQDYQRVNDALGGDSGVTDLVTNLVTQKEALLGMRADVAALMDGTVSQITFAQTSGPNLSITRDSLVVMDRMTANWLLSEGTAFDQQSPLASRASSNLVTDLPHLLSKRIEKFKTIVGPPAETVSQRREQISEIRDFGTSAINAAGLALTVATGNPGFFLAAKGASEIYWWSATIAGFTELALLETGYNVQTNVELSPNHYEETLQFANESGVAYFVKWASGKFTSPLKDVSPQGESYGKNAVEFAKMAANLVVKLTGTEDSKPNPPPPNSPPAQLGPVGTTIKDKWDQLRTALGVTDPGTPGLNVEPKTLMTSEDGDSDSFEISLTGAPSAPVNVSFVSTNELEGITRVQTVQFDASNWDSPHTVYVDGVDDGVVDGDKSYSITITTVSDDSRYNGRSASIAAVNKDNAPDCGLIVEPNSGLMTTEDGGTATFNLRLSRRPASPVDITVASSNPAEGTVEPQTITFDETNWNTSKRITIRGVDDSVVDGNVNYVINITAHSISKEYDGKSTSVAVINKDTDGAHSIAGTYTGAYTTNTGTIFDPAAPFEPRYNQTWSGNVTLVISNVTGINYLMFKANISVVTVLGTISIDTDGSYDLATKAFSLFGQKPGQSASIQGVVEGEDIVGKLRGLFQRGGPGDSCVFDNADIKLVRTA